MAESFSQGWRLARLGGMALAAMVLAGGWAGCVGTIGDGEPGAGDEAGEGADVLGSPDSRRLSPIEVEQTVDDILAEFGVATPADDLLLAPPDVRHTFSNTAESGNFTAGQVQNIMVWAESVSLAFSQDVDAALGCTPTSSWDGCVSDFAHRFGRLAFRQPLDDDDVETFRTVFVDVMQDAETPVDGVRAVVELALQSPQFWYLSNATRPDSQQLASHALAGRLSYFLWGTMPDATLREGRGSRRAAYARADSRAGRTALG